MIRVDFSLIGNAALKLQKSSDTIFLDGENLTVSDALLEFARRNSPPLNEDFYREYQIYLDSSDNHQPQNINSLCKGNTKLGRINRILLLYPFGGG